MHFLTLRERGSKIYSDTGYNIPMNNDNFHCTINQIKMEEAKSIQQRKQIDKIMHGIIKERLFGNFITDDTRMSDQNYQKINTIHKKTIDQKMSQTRKGKSHRFYSNKTIEMRQDLVDIRDKTNFNKTIQLFSHNSKNIQEQRMPHRFFQSQARTRQISVALPQIQRTETSKTTKIKISHQYHAKKLQFNEKAFGQTFKRWAGNNSQGTIYDIRISRETIIARFKNMVDPKMLQRFFHFFGFPQIFGLRQYASCMENATNTNLRFIYFWVFITLDEYSNGILNSQDLFRFMQKFSQNLENSYIEEEIYELARHIEKVQRTGKFERQTQMPPEQMLTVNRNLRMEELKDMLKQSNKQRIDVNCTKNTGYHRTLLSLEHDPHQRFKINQIQSNEAATEKMKSKKIESKKQEQPSPGLRLRDFPYFFNGRRPKIFCYFLHLLTNLRPNDYQ